MKKKTMQEMNEQYKDCPTDVNIYEIGSVRYELTSHFVGKKNINDVLLDYATNRITNEMLGRIPTAESA